jgi:PhzF family phenazine biosynthesis protein
VINRLALIRKARGPIWHQSFALCGPYSLTQIGFARSAEFAYTTLCRIERDHVVADLQRRHTLTKCLDNATAFMSQDHRKDAFRVLTGEREGIGMTNARGNNAHQHFTFAGRLDINLDNLEGLVWGKSYGSAGFDGHLDILRNEVVNNLGSYRRAQFNAVDFNNLMNADGMDTVTATYQFHQLDVFSKLPLLGNPLAVVHDATAITEETMAAFARWTNLSETTFLFPPTVPEADYRVRIFTPGRELPFAGHPTLGSCYAWLAAGGAPKSSQWIVQECGIGLIRIRRDQQKLAFAAPPLLRTGPLDAPQLQQIAAGLGIAQHDIVLHQWIDNGPGWCAVMLQTAQQVLAIKPDFSILKDLKLGLIAPQPAGCDTDYEVRAFVGSLGVPEDPVTGSLNAGLAVWLIGAGIASAHYVVSQGTALKRKGRVCIDQVGQDIWVGGDVAMCVQGTVEL